LPISLLHLAQRLDKSTLTPPNTQKEMKLRLIDRDFWLLAATAALIGAGGPLQPQDNKPNILFIIGDDIRLDATELLPPRLDGWGNAQ
jgi:hypothetical protein